MTTILTIRTDKPEAEIGLFEDGIKTDYAPWLAGRELSATVHGKIRDMLTANGRQLQDVQGLICFQGPGSFTGLRIGLTIANALAYGLGIPIVATQGETWLQKGIERLANGENDQVAVPEYGSAAHITLPKK